MGHYGVEASPAPSGACPVCGTSLSGAQSCSNCGYNPTTIASGGPALAAPPPRRSSGSMRFVVFASLVILVAGAAGYYVARYKRDVVRSVGSGIGLNHAIGPDLSPEECKQRMNHYLSGLFAATEDTGNAGEIATLQNQASEEFGVGTKEWTGLLDVYTSYAGIASIEGAKKALRKSASEVAHICAAEQ
jgi:hypothetical protein